jgi:signal transduction histidine kinase
MMVYRKLMTLTAVLMLLMGLIFFIANWEAMLRTYPGDGSLPEPAGQSMTIQSAISFGRLFGTMLFIVGITAWILRKLDRQEDQRSIGLGFFIGSLFLLIIALTQHAMWVTTDGWIIVSTIAVFPLSFGYMLFVEFGLTNFLTLSQDPEKLRQRWIRQLSEAAAQQERNRLARDLHDSIKQQIFSISVSAAAVQERWANDSVGARQALEDVRNSAREAMTEMEAMLHQLRPAPLENIGLVEALRKQAEALQYRTGAYVTTEFGDLPNNDILLPGTQEAIFRIAQEALNNIARHARAKNVHLRLYQQYDGENPMLWLKIEDNGSGFDTRLPAPGMGLANINVRAAEIGGHIHIESAPGEGTNLVVSIPLISPEVRKIRRMCHAIHVYAFAVSFILGFVSRYSGNNMGILLLFASLFLPLQFFWQREIGLIEKLRSMKNVPPKVSLGLARYGYQTLFFAYTLFLTSGIRWGFSNISWPRNYFTIFLLITLWGFIVVGPILRIHRIMKELKEKLPAIDFRESTEQMWRQTIITLMIAMPLVVVISWWKHSFDPLVFISLSVLYLGYAAWWRYKGYLKPAQGA